MKQLVANAALAAPAPKPRTHRRSLGALTALVLAALCLAGCSSSGQSNASSTSVAKRQASASPDATATTSTATPAPAATRAAAAAASTPGTALALLATIPVKAALPIAGYQRTADFGAAWLDEDHNGCDTRDDVLARDLKNVTRNSKCQVLTGSLADPYTGTTIAFQRGEKTSALVQIDHVVPLGDAWQTGAQALSPAERDDFANDDGNLLAVDEHDNEQKGDKDAAAWLPPDVAFRCTYVAIQISIKAAYGLWVTPAEAAAMKSVLASCPAQPTTTSEFEKVPAPKAAAAPAEPAAPAKAAAPVPAAPAAPVAVPAAPAAPVAKPAVPAAPIAPPASAPKRGEFCPTADRGKTVDGLTCEQKAAASGKLYWRWE